MTSLPVHAIWLDKTTKAALREYAWVNRTTMGDVVRAALHDIIANAAEVSVLSDTDEVSNSHFNVKADAEVWEAAVVAAQETGHSFNSLMRRRLRKLLSEEGLI